MYKEYGEVIENASLKDYNTYKVDAYVKYLVKVDSIANLQKLVDVLQKDDVKYFILGGGSNIILKNEYYDGVFISLENLNDIKIIDETLIAECGINLGLLIKKSLQESLGGLEYLALIPGTLGGALYGNAGVKEHDIYENLEYVEVLRNNKIIKLNKDDIKYSYRTTEFKNTTKVTTDILLRAKFKLYKQDKASLLEIVKTNRDKRMLTQPLEYPNAGSVFKNPEGMYAAKLIEDANLKGYHFNGAYVSDKHANFIVNKNHAKGSDIVNLINYIKSQVKEQFNVQLELEQIIVDWE